MFKITVDGIVIHDTGNPELQCFDIEYEIDVTASGSFNFSMAYNHPLIDFVTSNKIIRLYQNDELIIFGDLINTETDAYKTSHFEVWGLLHKLSQSTMPYIGSVSLDVKPLLELFVEQYNSDIGGKWAISVGDVTVTDPNDILPREINYGTVKDNITDKLITPLGGFLRLTETDTGFVLDYLISFNNINEQGIKFGQNLVDMLRERNTEEIYTAVRPYGSKVTLETEQRIDIKSVNNDSDIIFNPDAEEYFGRRVATVIYDDITTPSNLLTRGYEYLAQISQLQDSFTLDSVDLSLLDVEFERFKVGDTIPVISSVHGLDTITTVVKIKYKNEVPEITCGATTKTFSKEQNNINAVVGQINNSYVTNQHVTDKIENNNITTIIPMIQENSSNIEQTAEQIRLEVETNYVSNDKLQTSQETIISQTSEEIEFLRNTLSTNITDVDGKVDENQLLLQEYIRFDGAKIEMGKVGNAFTVELDNERLAFMENQQVISYISNQKLYITSAEIINDLQIGNFRWKPRSNGNLSFVFVGG